MVLVIAAANGATNAFICTRGDDPIRFDLSGTCESKTKWRNAVLENLGTNVQNTRVTDSNWTARCP